MGNYKFRFSDMIPNVWFYKLKDMNTTRKKQQHNNPIKKKPPSSIISNTTASLQNSQSKYSYYFSSTQQPAKPDKFFSKASSDIRLLDSPRRSSKKKTRRKNIYNPSPNKQQHVSSASAQVCRCHVPTLSDSDYYYSPNSPQPYYNNDLYYDESIPSASDCDEFTIASHQKPAGSWSSSSLCNDRDFIMDECFSKLELPPIFTKPAEKSYHGNNTSHSFKIRTSKSKQEIVNKRNHLTRKSPSTTSPGIKLRSNSPRIQACARKSVSSSKMTKKNMSLSEQSFAVVKSSIDPQKDFRESMMEMVMENNLRASSDLEELLACYLQLNSSECHDLIVKAFEEIWFDITKQW